MLISDVFNCLGTFSIASGIAGLLVWGYMPFLFPLLFGISFWWVGKGLEHLEGMGF